jgi:hypothetical protein
MFITCNYTEAADRERLYMAAWRIQAKYHAMLPAEDQEALMSIKRAFYLEAPYDTLIAGHVERMAATLLKKRHYTY